MIVMKTELGDKKNHEDKEKAGHRHMTSFQIIILGFMGVILAGSLLLMLPWASRSGRWSSFSDTLFTATSAVCVTGLVVQDTATYWSEFGQVIILLLIQIGGLGVVTVAVSIATIAGRKIGLMQRSTMQEAIAAPKMGGIVRMTTFILKTSFLIELIGAVILFPVFYREFGLGKGIWYAVFHAISAFCNAGFDLMGVKGKFSSLTSFAANPVVNLVIMTLIVVGGIGFLPGWISRRINGILKIPAAEQSSSWSQCLSDPGSGDHVLFWNFSICRWENGSGVLFPVCDNKNSWI